MDKKLYKGENKMLLGVCSGVAEYLNVDVTIVRLVFAVLFLTGTSMILYLICAIIMPEKPQQFNQNQFNSDYQSNPNGQNFNANNQNNYNQNNQGHPYK